MNRIIFCIIVLSIFTVNAQDIIQVTPSSVTKHVIDDKSESGFESELKDQKLSVAFVNNTDTCEGHITFLLTGSKNEITSIIDFDASNSFYKTIKGDGGPIITISSIIESKSVMISTDVGWFAKVFAVGGYLYFIDNNTEGNIIYFETLLTSEEMDQIYSTVEKVLKEYGFYHYGQDEDNTSSSLSKQLIVKPLSPVEFAEHPFGFMPKTVGSMNEITSLLKRNGWPSTLMPPGNKTLMSISSDDSFKIPYTMFGAPVTEMSAFCMNRGKIEFYDLEIKCLKSGYSMTDCIKLADKIVNSLKEVGYECAQEASEDSDVFYYYNLYSEDQNITISIKCEGTEAYVIIFDVSC